MEVSLLGFAHPVKGSPFEVHGVCTRTTLTRGCILEESRVVALVYLLYTCIRTL